MYQISSLFLPATEYWVALMANVTPQMAARTELRGGLTLRIPVEGGGKQLKHRNANPDRILLSNHGKWRHEHLAAMSAVYGKAPYFGYLFPLIQEVYENSEGMTLGEFNRRLNGVMDRVLNREGTRGSLLKMQEEHPARLDAICRGVKGKIDYSISIIDAVFRLGPEAVFGLILNDKSF